MSCCARTKKQVGNSLWRTVLNWQEVTVTPSYKMLDDGGTRWLSQGFSAGEGENTWDAKGGVCVPTLALPCRVLTAEETWQKADAPQYVPSLPFAMFTPSRTLSFSSPLLPLSLEHVYCIDTWAILPFLLPIQSNFVIIEKKKRKWNLSSTTCSLQTHSPSCIFGALQTLSGKNCSGLGHVASAVTGSPYKEKDNRKWVKTCR